VGRDFLLGQALSLAWCVGRQKTARVLSFWLTIVLGTVHRPAAYRARYVPNRRRRSAFRTFRAEQNIRLSTLVGLLSRSESGRWARLLTAGRRSMFLRARASLDCPSSCGSVWTFFAGLRFFSRNGRGGFPCRSTMGGGPGTQATLGAQRLHRLPVPVRGPRRLPTSSGLTILATPKSDKCKRRVFL